MEFPRLRPIEAIPVNVSGRRMIALQDPMGFCKDTVLVSSNTFFIISLFNGEHSISDIQVAYTRKFGDIMFSDKIRALVDDLDSKYLLESDNFKCFKEEGERRFREEKIIKSRQAGVSYPGDADLLRRQLDEYFEHPEVKGRAAKKVPGRISGIISPHIDFARGGITYAIAYSMLCNWNEGGLVLVLGTCHSPTKNYFVGTAKDFETPLGVVRSDREIMESIAKEYPSDIFEDEIFFQFEHSLDFQLIFLQHILGKGEKFKIIPLLCGSFDSIMKDGKTPSEVEEVKKMSDLLNKIVYGLKGNVCIIAGADLAHVGMRFGDPYPPSPGTLSTLAEEDGAMLEYVKESDAEGFFKNIQSDGDKRRICGLSAIYMLLTTLGNAKGERLFYNQCMDPAGHSVVTISALNFT